MNLADLIRRFRVLANDKAQPYLFDGDDVADWLNDAQRQACIRGRLLREDANPLLCSIALTAGKNTYALHPAVYELIDLRIAPTDGGRTRPLAIVSREWLGANDPDWRDSDREVRHVIQADTSIRVVGRVETGDVLRLECYRLPIKALETDADKPEIHQAHHEHLIQWALAQAFSVVDAETLDPRRAQEAEGNFTRYFGPLPDSDMRRITREDVSHHNEAILP